MSEKPNPHKFPDKETLLEYLRGGLTHSERHWIEKLMLEHDFLREAVEGLESEDSELIEDDLVDLSYTIQSRSMMYRKTGFNFYQLAATISLIIMTSVLIYVLVDWIIQSNQEKKLSLNQTIQTEVADSVRENNPIQSGKIEQDKGEAAQLVEKEKERIPERSNENRIGEAVLNSAPVSSEEPEKKADNPRAEKPVAGRVERIPVQEEEISTLANNKSIPEKLTLKEENKRVNENYNRWKDREEPMAAEVSGADHAMTDNKLSEETVKTMAMKASIPDREPSPINGYGAFQQYLQDSLIYPMEALKNKVEGMVIVNFTVGKDSIPQRFTLKQSVGYGCDEEAIRLIRQGPRWKPVIIEGEAVESTVEIPVKFIIPVEQ